MDELKHYGTPTKSGRYPWGSGEDPDQSGRTFLSKIEYLRRKGLSETEIAEGLGLNTSQLRARKTISKEAVKAEDRARAIRLKDKGYSNSEIGRLMSKNESSIRALLDPVLQERAEMTINTANILRDSVNKKNYIDVGLGVENHLGVSRTKLKTAIEMLKDEGYKVHYLDVMQAGTGKKTSLMTLAKPDIEWKEINANKDKIEMPTEYHTKDGGKTFNTLRPIQNVDSKRILIKYNEDGGSLKDGVIELRRGVEDLDLGSSKYAQVRVGVDGSHYLKGVAIYSDDVPNGYDIIYNSNKPKGTPPEKVFKSMERDLNGDIDYKNPFGAQIKKGGQKGALNIVNEEGSWLAWDKNLSSQVLSKQPKELIKKQLDLAFATKKEEYDEIMRLTNPTVKKNLLISFADDCDASAVHLKAAALPRQMTHLILPFPNMKENQVYAPNYRNGEKVVLIRHPHGGIFEIPELTVNNKQPLIEKIIGRPKDAIGIHPKVAEQLSGADFDGDTVIVIPTNGKTINTSKPLKDLQNFNPKESYKGYPGMKKLEGEAMQKKMGDISNLITDMTIRGANESEIARAVRHSMVVIDAEKHNLNYKQSYDDNGIGALKKKYQGSEKAGASTLISKASSPERVMLRKDQYKIDPKTGKKVYSYIDEKYTNKKGEVVQRTLSSTKMAEADDAFSLSSGTLVEGIYASYANKLKALANTSRKKSLETKTLSYSPSARKTYENEVNSLKAKLNLALQNAPIERKAQLIANRIISEKKKAYPDYTKEDLKKFRGQALEEARYRTGASKQRINITPKEWDAIQAGAVTNHILTQILSNTNKDDIRKLATPKTSLSLTPAKMAKAKAMLNSGYTQAEIADSLGISTNTLAKALE